MNSKRKYFAFGESARMAFETLLANKLRSALTVLGVFIAVVVLVMVFSIMVQGFRGKSLPAVRAAQGRFRAAVFWHSGELLKRRGKRQRHRSHVGAGYPNGADFRAVHERRRPGPGCDPEHSAAAVTRAGTP